MQLVHMYIVLAILVSVMIMQLIFAIYVIHSWISEGHCDDFFEALNDWNQK
jgi:hypothetical protein